MVQKRKAQVLATDLLKRFNINKRPVDIEKIAKDLGIKVNYVKFNSDEISGLLLRKGDKVKLGVNSNHHEHRQRFTIAHEIGHFLLHTNKFIYVDGLKPLYRDNVSSQGVDKEEIEANTFAAEILMPEHIIIKDIENTKKWNQDTIKGLADKYNVSVEAFVIKLNNMGYIYP